MFLRVPVVEKCFKKFLIQRTSWTSWKWAKLVILKLQVSQRNYVNIEFGRGCTVCYFRPRPNIFKVNTIFFNIGIRFQYYIASLLMNYEVTSLTQQCRKAILLTHLSAPRYIFMSGPVSSKIYIPYIHITLFCQ